MFHCLPNNMRKKLNYLNLTQSQIGGWGRGREGQDGKWAHFHWLSCLSLTLQQYKVADSNWVDFAHL